MDYELGIIGGMGPLATEVFFDYIIRHTKSNKDQDHINAIILNHTNLPDRTEAIQTKQYDDFLTAIANDFKLLNELQLKAVAIPCNTSHFFYDIISGYSNAPIINMIDETIKECKDRGNNKLVIFGTQGTLNSKIYNNYAEKYGVEIIEPALKDAKKIMEIIYQVKAENITYLPILDELINKYSQYGQVVLACTELSSIEIESTQVVDSLKILGDRAIEACNREVIK